jgi:hypothetical protein
MSVMYPFTSKNINYEHLKVRAQDIIRTKYKRVQDIKNEKLWFYMSADEVQESNEEKIKP